MEDTISFMETKMTKLDLAKNLINIFIRNQQSISKSPLNQYTILVINDNAYFVNIIIIIII